MRALFTAILVVHGAIHLLGPVKAFGIVEVPQLAHPISRPMGIAWLLAASLIVAAAIARHTAPQWWWALGVPALVLSQIAIVASWGDARFGTVPNVILLAALVIALADLRSGSFRSTFAREVARGLARTGDTRVVTEAELVPLPPLVATYLRRVGVVGRPHVRAMRAEFRGRMRNGRDAPWMRVTAEQHSFFDQPTRIFLMRASMHGLPFQALHVFTGPSATMQVRIGGIIEVVSARGPEMDRSETVTHFNDMCLLAPATLVDADVSWETLDARRVRATYTRGAHTIRAELLFDEMGDLREFLSYDRSQSADGVTFRNLPWATPVRQQHDHDGARLPSRADAVWRPPEGAFTYAEFELTGVSYDGRPPGA